MPSELPNIFDYIDFRKFLEDYREARNELEAGFTHYYICHRLGMKNSRSYFNNIVKGRKNIGSEIVEKLIVLFELKHDQANYFRTLVNYGQTKNSREKQFYFDQLIELNNTPRKIIDEDTYEYFKEWYHPVVRELLECFEFTGEYSDLAGRLDPPISVKEAKKSIALLERLRLIGRDESGVYKAMDKVVCTQDNARSHIIQQHQIRSFEQAQSRIANDPGKHKTTTLTISVSEESLKKIVLKMEQFRSAVRSIAHKDISAGKRVYEIIVHAHTQTK